MRRRSADYGMDKQSSRDKKNDHSGGCDTCRMDFRAACRACPGESNVSVRWRYEVNKKIVMGYFMHYCFYHRVCYLAYHKTFVHYGYRGKQLYATERRCGRSEIPW